MFGRPGGHESDGQDDALWRDAEAPRFLGVLADVLANRAFVACSEREADFGEAGFEDASELCDAIIVVHGLKLGTNRARLAGRFPRTECYRGNLPRFGERGAFGNRNVSRDPTPIVLSTVKSPFIARARSRLIVSPSPTPPRRSVRPFAS